MTENFDLDREDSFNNLTESQFDFSIGERPSTVGSSTPSRDKNKELNDKIDKSDKTINEIKKENDELKFELKQIKEGKIVVYKYVINKWKYISSDCKCCDNNCVNANNPYGFCREGNGYGQIKNNTEIEYINCKGIGYNKLVRIESEHYFTKPINELIQTFTLYYYEVKVKFDKDEVIEIGLRNGNDNICLFANDKAIYKSIFCLFQNNLKSIKLPSLTYKTNDIIGCGLVYPPPNKLPYVFFTLNGKQIGKAILIEEDCASIRPYVELKLCSIEANFGDNTFMYDVDKHYVTDEFYKEEEFEDI